MRNIKDEPNLNQKKVLLRLDLNVPLNNGKITDTTRIDKIIPTISFLLKNNAKVIILSHVGRPKGKIVNELSLKPICKNLENKLNESVKLITTNPKEINSNDLFNNQDEKIVMLENIRFYEEEEENNPTFAKHLASLADIYVNDAFSCSHRTHASIYEITKEKINNAFTDASKKQSIRILEITMEKLVSIDFNHNSASAIIDASLTNVVGDKMGKISAWYDNEWGFSNRMCDIAEYLHEIS